MRAEEKRMKLQQWKEVTGYDRHKERSKIINARVEAIRQRIWKSEKHKQDILENYIIDLYYIETASPIELLKQYGLIEEYNTDQYSDDFLTLKNKNNAE